MSQPPSPAEPDFSPTPRTTLKRAPARGRFDRETVYAILDEGLICHVGIAVEGRPVVLPTIHARVGDRLYLHGATANRLLRAIAGGGEACVSVTCIDGLVIARSAFHHSMNYRSVTLFGPGRPVDDEAEKTEALRAIVEHVTPGRWRDVRPPNPVELKRTLVIAIPIEEVSAKVRTGPPIDEEEDYALDVWAGVIPLGLRPGAPTPDERLAAERECPPYLTDWRRPATAD
jgi:nitroimidazol reductase NimA-like FMN-containing flavoprotein (pyridoxamine 5'-phosphate oxidase superfamily)